MKVEHKNRGLAVILLVFWCLTCLYGVSYAFHLLPVNFFQLWYGFATIISLIVTGFLVAFVGGAIIWEVLGKE